MQLRGWIDEIQAFIQSEKTMTHEPYDGREPLDSSECPDSEDVCERDYNSGEVLLCNSHYVKAFRPIPEKRERGHKWR